MPNCTKTGLKNQWQQWSGVVKTDAKLTFHCVICITLDNDSGVTRQLFALEISPVVKAFLSVCPFLVQIAHFCFVFVVVLYIDKLCLV